jgi:hypothetical protein
MSKFVDDEEEDQPFHVIDVRGWPTVEIKVLRAPYNDGEIDVFQDAFLQVLNLAATGTDRIPPTKLFLLFNMDGIVQASFSQKLRAKTFIQQVRSAAETSIHATALVVTNTLARMVLGAVMMLQPLVSVNKVFDNNDDALMWLAANKSRVSRGFPAVTDLDVATS